MIDSKIIQDAKNAAIDAVKNKNKQLDGGFHVVTIKDCLIEDDKVAIDCVSTGKGHEGETGYLIVDLQDDVSMSLFGCVLLSGDIDSIDNAGDLLGVSFRGRFERGECKEISLEQLERFDDVSNLIEQKIASRLDEKQAQFVLSRRDDIREDVREDAEIEREK